MSQPSSIDESSTILKRVLRFCGGGIVRKSAWGLVVVFTLAFMIMPWADPGMIEESHGKGYPFHFLYWFGVTVSTVGFGDISPGTISGRMVTLVIVSYGVAINTLIVSSLTSYLVDFKTKKRKGKKNVKKEKHTIIVGYKKGDTEALIKELIADKKQTKKDIVLLSEDCTEAPIEDIDFVAGLLTESETLENACVSKASEILICRADDNKTLVASGIMRARNPNAHIVAFAQKQYTADVFDALENNKVEVIKPMAIKMMAQSIQDPGISYVINQAISNQVGQTFYNVEAVCDHGEAVEVGSLREMMQAEYGAMLFSVTRDSEQEPIINPKENLAIKLGDTISYVAPERIDQLDFDEKMLLKFK